MSFQLLGIGTAVPEHYIEQADAASLAASFCSDGDRHTRSLTAIYRRTRVETRHSVVLDATTNGTPARQTFYSAAQSIDDRGPTTADRMKSFESHAAGLAEQASSTAMAAAQIVPRDITHLVTVSCTGFSAPGFDITLVRQLHLRDDVQRTNVGFMGCHGGLNGLRVARAFTDSDPQACVLLCAAELCSLHQQYGFHTDRVVSNALFADGSAAIIGQRTSNSVNDDERQLVDSTSTIIPGTESHMSWRIRDHGFEMSLSAQVPATIREWLRPWLDRWLANHQLQVRDVRGWAIHPGGPRILQVCQDSLQLDDTYLQPSRDVLAEFGNMSSPTVIFILDQLRRQHAEPPWVVLGFGPGLTIEAALIR